MNAIQLTGLLLDETLPKVWDVCASLGVPRCMFTRFDFSSEGCVMVVFDDPATASEAADLLDSYPMTNGMLTTATQVDPRRWLLESALALMPSHPAHPVHPAQATQTTQPFPQPTQATQSFPHAPPVWPPSPSASMASTSSGAELPGLANLGPGWVPTFSTDPSPANTTPANTTPANTTPEPVWVARAVNQATTAQPRSKLTPLTHGRTGTPEAIFIRFVDERVSKYTVHEVMKRFGAVQSIFMNTHGQPNREGVLLKFAIVRFSSADEASAAISGLNGRIVRSLNSGGPLNVSQHAGSRSNNMF